MALARRDLREGGVEGAARRVVLEGQDVPMSRRVAAGRGRRQKVVVGKQERFCCRKAFQFNFKLRRYADLKAWQAKAVNLDLEQRAR